MNISKIDKRIIEYLKDKGYKTDNQIKEFLNPSFDSLHDPFLLDGMQEAKERIEKAINLNEKIVIYGDYDCDGISACVILYKYFLSRGILCDVYIPNRFDDGYGLSFDMIDEVIKNSKPDLIITVDLGITAVNEVEEIKSKGVDIIVTDHHEPSEILPKCIVIDPKKGGQKYPFNGLCGAGVALKLVEALSGREEIKKYLDVCAVATVGDIVPLVDENRVIAKLGINMFNSEDCNCGYKYMTKELGLKKLNTTDITFKIVPRINASGRMSNGKKVFDFLVEEDLKKQKILFDEMVKDNEERLESIATGVQCLEEEMKNINLSQENVILLKGEFHQGVLGILASRICHDYNRPAIIFTKTESGTLKGSGRSLDSIDMHEALENVKDCLVRFGGHKMAVGVELKEEDFDGFKQRLSKEISKKLNIKAFINEENYDIEITENDINKDFINDLNLLEPFGCKNEKPLLMLEAKKLNVSQMKDQNYKHFKLSTAHGKSIVAFSAEKHIEALRSSVKKHLILDLENNVFKGKIYPQAVLKNVFIKEIGIDNDEERECILSLISKYNSHTTKQERKSTEYEPFELEKLLNKLSGNGFGTIVVVDSFSSAERMKNIYPKLKGYTISHVPLKNKQNTLLISSRFPVDKSEIEGYNNVVFTRRIFGYEKDYLNDVNVYVVKKRSLNNIKLDGSRNVNIAVYNLVKKYAKTIYANNIFEWLEKIQAVEGGLSKAQIMFSCLAFMDLGFINIKFAPNFEIDVVENPPKKELSSSRFMNNIVQRNF